MNVRRLRPWMLLLPTAAAVFTLALKFAAFWVTGSIGLLSDAAESVVNVVAAGAGFGALWYAARPVDQSHTYGHEKIEFFSSGVEGTFIVGAALAVGWAALERLWQPPSLHQLDLGLALALAAALINLGVGRILLRQARQTHSVLMEAQGRHLLTDVWTTVGVLAGLVVVRVTAMVWLDPAMGLVVALFILRTGVDLLWRSFDGLMDRALPDSELHALREVLAARLPRGTTFHGLRSRRAGTQRFVDFHLLVPGKWHVARAHALVQELEHAIAERLRNAQTTVHVEPVEEPAAWSDTPLVESGLPRPPGAPPNGSAT